MQNLIMSIGLTQIPTNTLTIGKLPCSSNGVNFEVTGCVIFDESKEKILCRAVDSILSVLTAEHFLDEDKKFATEEFVNSLRKHLDTL